MNDREAAMSEKMSTYREIEPGESRSRPRPSTNLKMGD